MKAHHYFLVFALFILASCEKMATNVDVPSVPAQLVLFGFISPEEEYTKVQLSLSKPVFGSRNNGNPYDYIRDAVVTITNDGGQSAVMVYADSVNGYVITRSDFPVEASRTYTISAVSGSYKVTSSCKVPADTIGFTEITYLKTGEPGQTDGPAYRYQYKWNDAAGKVNYYRVVSQNVYDFGMGIPYSQDICNSFISDEGKDGNSLSSSCEDYNSYQNDTLYFYLLNTDEPYYEYTRRRINYFGDDPFSEPSPQYSNVNGGLGVFCAYRKTLRKVKIDP